MKQERPIKRTMTILVTYFDCGKETHKHKSETAAEACIGRHGNRTLPTMKEKYARQFPAFLQVINGTTFKEVSEILGLTSSRRAQKAIMRLMKLSLRDDILNEVSPPPGTWWRLSEIRKHRIFWQKRADILAKRWNINQEDNPPC